MPGYFIYCRKSSEAEDRQVLSIESQTRELVQLAARLNISVVEVLSEARTAREPGRRVFNQMMERLYRGEAAGILCWKLDRLARNPVDGGSVIWAIRQQGIRVFTPAQSYSRDDDNLILLYIEFGMAQKYVDDLSKNVKRGLKTKSENGWHPGVAPVGYLNHTDRLTGENTIIKDPNLFPLVRRMWEHMLTGAYTPPRIRALANEAWGFRTRRTRKMGGKPLAMSAIYLIFTRPFYYGEFEYPQGSGRWHQGRHEPMVTRDEYDRVQLLLGRRGNPRPKAHYAFAFTGLIVCAGCGGMVTAAEKHQLICGVCRFKFAHRTREACPKCQSPIARMAQPQFLRYTYYHCGRRKNPSCREPAIRGEVLERQIMALLGRLEVPARVKEWGVNALRELHRHEVAAGADIGESRRRARDLVEQRLTRLVKLQTAPANADGSLLSDAEYAQQRGELLRERNALAEAIQSASLDQCLKKAEQTFTFACGMQERFVQGTPVEKKELVIAVGWNLTLSGKTLRFEAKEPFRLIAEVLAGGQTESGPLEPAADGSTRPCGWAVPVRIPSLCGDWEDVGTWEHKAAHAAALIYAHFKGELDSSAKPSVRQVPPGPTGCADSTGPAPAP